MSGGKSSRRLTPACLQRIFVLITCRLISTIAIITRTARRRGCAPEIARHFLRFSPLTRYRSAGFLFLHEGSHYECRTRLRKNGRPRPRRRAGPLHGRSPHGGIHESPGAPAYFEGRLRDIL